ncbi:MAG: PEP-CTERM sorting domain-containing protein [Planctomycetota bacterium]
MKFLAFSTRIVAVAAITTAFTTSASAFLATNGGFETGDLTGWTASGAPFVNPPDTWEVIDDASEAFDGQYYGRLEAVSTPSGPVAKQANIGIGVVNPGDEITVSFWARGATAVGGVHFVELFGELSGGGTSSSEIIGGPVLTDLSATEWKFYEFSGILTGADVTGGATVQFVASTGASNGSSSYLELDNVTIVPEPASLALLGLGGLAMLGRRRRQA